MHCSFFFLPRCATNNCNGPKVHRTAKKKTHYMHIGQWPANNLRLYFTYMKQWAMLMNLLNRIPLDTNNTHSKYQWFVRHGFLFLGNVCSAEGGKPSDFIIFCIFFFFAFQVITDSIVSVEKMRCFRHGR